MYGALCGAAAADSVAAAARVRSLRDAAVNRSENAFRAAAERLKIRLLT